jgi:hypothetical protein
MRRRTVIVFGNPKHETPAMVRTPLNLLGNIRSVVGSRTKGGFWRAIKAPLAWISTAGN